MNWFSRNYLTIGFSGCGGCNCFLNDIIHKYIGNSNTTFSKLDKALSEAWEFVKSLFHNYECISFLTCFIKIIKKLRVIVVIISQVFKVKIIQAGEDFRELLN